MKKFLSIGIASILCLFFTIFLFIGCSSSPVKEDIVGTWTVESMVTSDGEELNSLDAIEEKVGGIPTFEFYEDETVTGEMNGATWESSWELNSDKVKVTRENLTEEYTLKEGKLISNGLEGSMVLTKL